MTGKYRGQELGYAKPKVFINKDRTGDPIAQAIIRYAQVATHKKQVGTGYMLEIGTMLPEGVELIRQQELKKLKKLQEGRRQKGALPRTPLVGSWVSALPKHKVQQRMHPDHSYEELYKSPYRQETADFLSNKRSEMEGRKVSMDEAVVRIENQLL